MNAKSVILPGLNVLGGAVLIGSGAHLIFRAGCQYSLNLLELLIKSRDPELCYRIAEVLTKKEDEAE